MHNKLLKTTLKVLFTTLLLTSCSSKLEQEINNLKLENESLKAEIEDIKFGASILFEKGKTLFENDNLEEASSTFEILASKHPEAKETTEAKTYLSEISKAIKEKEEKEEKEKKERLSNATKKLRSKYDDMREITWLHDKSTTSYTDVNSIYLYMATKENSSPALRFRIQYAGDDWLFIENYIIKTDNNTHTISTSYGDIEKDNGYGGVWEWYDIAMNQSTYTIVQDMINSKNVKIRHNGKQYHKDRNLTNKEKEAMKNVLDAYEALGGTLNF